MQNYTPVKASSYSKYRLYKNMLRRASTRGNRTNVGRTRYEKR